MEWLSRSAASVLAVAHTVLLRACTPAGITGHCYVLSAVHCASPCSCGSAASAQLLAEAALTAGSCGSLNTVVASACMLSPSPSVLAYACTATAYCVCTYVVRCTRGLHSPLRCTWTVCSAFGLSYAPRTAVRVRGLYSDRTCGAPHVALRSAIHSSAFVTLWCSGPLWPLSGVEPDPVVLKQK